MLPTLVSFYLFSIIIITAALGIIFAPRMYLSLISFLILIIFSSLMFFDLKASYVAIFQLILCGIFLCGYIFILLKKIGRINLKNKLVPVFKILSGTVTLAIFGGLIFWFFIEDFSNSLFDIFDYVFVKTENTMIFSNHAFPLYLVMLLVFVSAVVIRVFLLSSQNSALSSEGCVMKSYNDDDEDNTGDGTND